MPKVARKLREERREAWNKFSPTASEEIIPTDIFILDFPAFRTARWWFSVVLSHSLWCSVRVALENTYTGSIWGTEDPWSYNSRTQCSAFLHPTSIFLLVCESFLEIGKCIDFQGLPMPTNLGSLGWFPQITRGCCCNTNYDQYIWVDLDDLRPPFMVTLEN